MTNIADENWPIGKLYGDYYAYDLDNELIYLIDPDGNIKGLPTPVTIWLNKKGFIQKEKYGDELYVTEDEDYMWVFDPDRAFVAGDRVPGAYKITDTLLADLAYIQENDFYEDAEPEEDTPVEDSDEPDEDNVASKKRKTGKKVTKTKDNPTVPLLVGGASLAGLLLLLSRNKTPRTVVTGTPQLLPVAQPLNVTEDVDTLLEALQSAANNEEPPAYLKSQISQFTKIFLNAAGAVTSPEINTTKVIYTICQDPMVSQYIPSKPYDFAKSVIYILHNLDNIKSDISRYLPLLLDINQKIDSYIADKIYLVLTSLLAAVPYIDEAVNRTGQELLQQPNHQTYTEHIKALINLFDNSEAVDKYISSINYSIISDKVMQEVVEKYRDALEQNSNKQNSTGNEGKSFGNGVVIKRNV